MKRSKSETEGGLDRLNGLMAWWGFPNAAKGTGMTAPVMQFQVLLLELNKVLNEAASTQAQAFSAASQHVGRAVQAAMSARQPLELIDAQAKLIGSLIECFAGQSAFWADLTQKLGDCCTDSICKPDQEPEERAERQAPVEPRPASRRTSVRESAGHATPV